MLLLLLPGFGHITHTQGNKSDKTHADKHQRAGAHAREHHLEQCTHAPQVVHERQCVAAEAVNVVGLRRARVVAVGPFCRAPVPTHVRRDGVETGGAQNRQLVPPGIPVVCVVITFCGCVVAVAVGAWWWWWWWWWWWRRWRRWWWSQGRGGAQRMAVPKVRADIH